MKIKNDPSDDSGVKLILIDLAVCRCPRTILEDN